MKAIPWKVAPSGDGLKGRQVLWALIAFFGLVFGVNAYFIFAALSTYSGDVAIEPYRKGLNYNQRIEAGARQSLLGWRDTLEVTRDGRISVLIVDRGGEPLNGLKVMAVISRPSTAREDHTTELVQRADGRFTADVAHLAAGKWIAEIEARDPLNDAHVYRSRRRVWLKPSE